MSDRRVFLLASLLLAGCGGPRLSAETIAGRTVMITNGGDRQLTIQRIVANGEEGRAECTDTPGATLGPGRSYTVTFFYCDEVNRLRVETDAGTTTVRP